MSIPVIQWSFFSIYYFVSIAWFAERGAGQINSPTFSLVVCAQYIKEHASNSAVLTPSKIKSPRLELRVFNNPYLLFNNVNVHPPRTKKLFCTWLGKLLITRSGRRRVEFFFLVSHLICKINLSRRYLRRFDSTVARTSDLESAGPGSIPGGRVQNSYCHYSPTPALI